MMMATNTGRPAHRLRWGEHSATPPTQSARNPPRPSRRRKQESGSPKLWSFVRIMLVLIDVDVDQTAVAQVMAEFWAVQR